MKNPDDINQYSDNDKSIIRKNQERLTLLHDELNALIMFPPFSLSSKMYEYADYEIDLGEQYRKELRYPLSEFLDTEMRPLRNFVKKYAAEIAEARSYRNRSGTNPTKALDLYKKENPNAKITPEDYIIRFIEI